MKTTNHPANLARSQDRHLFLGQILIVWCLIASILVGTPRQAAAQSPEASSDDPIGSYEPPSAEGVSGSSEVEVLLNRRDWWTPLRQPLLSTDTASAGIGGGVGAVINGDRDLVVRDTPRKVGQTLSPFGRAVMIDRRTSTPSSRSMNLEGGGKLETYTLEFSYGPEDFQGGADVESRLRLVRYDGCVETTSGLDCLVITPLDSSVNKTSNVVEAMMDDASAAQQIKTELDAAEERGDDLSKFRDGLDPAWFDNAVTASEAWTLANQASFVALAAAPAGPTGDYTATPTESISSFEVSTATGSLDARYDIDVPAAAAGITPDISLLYSSGSVDGMNAATNTQGGPVGLGWTLGVGGSISRQLKPCNTGSDAKCLFGDGEDVGKERFTIALNGVSSRLVRVEGNEYRLLDDPVWRVFFYDEDNQPNGESADHGYRRGEWWEVRTPDGTRWQFGRDKNSARYIPVCYSGGQPDNCTEKEKLADTVYEWDLDRIIDTSGNQVNFDYLQELNYYNAGGAKNEFNLPYVRYSAVDTIEYGSNVDGALANARVVFSWEQRCSGWGLPDGDCEFKPENYPDVPVDQWCPAETSSCTSNVTATFWSQLRLGAVSAQLRVDTGDDSTKWVTTAAHDLVQYFPDPVDDDDGDENQTKLALLQIRERPNKTNGATYQHYGFGTLGGPLFDDADGTATFRAGVGDVGFDSAVLVGDASRLIYDDVWTGGTGEGEMATKVAIRYANEASATSVDVVADGAVVATIPLEKTEDWRTFKTATTDIEIPGGVLDVELRFSGAEEAALITWFQFFTGVDEFAQLPGLPPVTYAGDGSQNNWEWLPNRVNAPQNIADMKMPRIKRIENELGGVSEFRYGQSAPCEPGVIYNFAEHELDCYGAPAGGDDVGSVAWEKWKILGAVTEPGASQPPIEQTFEYVSPPKWAYEPFAFKDNQEGCNQNSYFSDFRGHNIVRVTDAAGITEYRFFQGMDGDGSTCPGAGSKDVSVSTSTGLTFDDDRILQSSEYEMRRLALDGEELERTITLFDDDQGEFSPDDEKGIFVTAGSGRDAARFVAPWRIETTAIGSTDKTNVVEYRYDEFGNKVEERQLGDADTDTDDRTVNTDYVQHESKWIVSTPCRERVSTNGGAVLSETRWGYDRQRSQVAAGSCADEPDRGLPTSEWAYSTDDAASQTSSVFNERGQAVETSDPNGNRSIMELNVLQGWVESETNPLGWTTSYRYNELGQQIQITDVNDNITQLGYDEYDRLSDVRLPGGDEQRPDYVFSYAPDQRPVAVQTKQLFDAEQAGDDAYLLSVQYLDGLGRDVQTQARAQTPGKRWISTAVFDGAGRMHRESTAFEQNGEPSIEGNYFAPDWSTVPTYREFRYDARGEILQDRSIGQAPGQDKTDWHIDYSYDAWTTSTFDTSEDRGNRTDYRYDAFGNLAEVTEYDGQTEKYGTTTHVYDGADRLIASTDAKGNATTVAYDRLGRRVRVDDPSVGEWLSFYDANGNMTLQRDARNTWLRFDYDELDRLVRRRVSNENAGDGELRAEWSFDDPSIGKDRLFRSVTFADNQPTVEVRNVAYDAQGQIIEQHTDVSTSAGGSFVQKFTYGAGGQQLSARNPGDNALAPGDVVSTRFDPRTGLAVGLTSAEHGTIVENTVYGPDGQRRERTYGPGGKAASERWEVDQRTERTMRYQAGIGDSQSNVVSHTYDYDVRGNTTSIVDGVDDGQKVCFGYDNFSRLVRGFTADDECRSSDLGRGTDPFDESYEYDTIHNLTEKSGVGKLTYGTEGQGPLWVTATSSGDAFSYDPNGNQTLRRVDDQSTLLTYNAENRLAEIRVGTGDGGTWDGKRVYLRNEMTGRYLRTTTGGPGNVDQDVRASVTTQWTFNELDNGNYRLTDADGDALVAVEVSRRYNVETSDAPDAADEWQLVDLGDGSYRLRNVQFGQFLDADKLRENYNVDLSPREETDGAWRPIELGRTPSEDPFGFDGSTIELRGTASGELLHAGTGNIDVAADASDRTRWRVERLDNGYYQLFNEAESGYLDGDGANVDYNVDLSQQPRADDQWEIQNFGDGNFRFFNVYRKRYLRSAADAENANVDQGPVRNDETLWNVSPSSGRVPPQLAFVEAEAEQLAEQGELLESYWYNADDGVVGRVQPDETVVYVGDTFEWHTSEAEGSFAVSQYFLGGRRVAIDEAGDLSFTFNDHLNSAAAIASGQNDISVGRYRPWGETRGEPLGGSLGFGGQRPSAITGLVDFDTRFYDPSLGRFISPDRSVPDFNNPLAANRYAYALNNPATFFDPNGEWGISSIKKAVKKVGGSVAKATKKAVKVAKSIDPHTALDVAGMVPGLGEFADAANAGLYLLEGDYANAALSAAAIIPVVGGAGTATRLGCKVACDKVVKSVAEMSDSGVAQKGLKRFKSAGRGGSGPVRQGAEGVERAVKDLDAKGHKVVAREVTVDVIIPKGNSYTTVRTRPDLLVRTPRGKLYFMEVKSGPSARLTKNQKRGFPGIRQNGFFFRGGNARSAGLTTGTFNRPMKVVVKHFTKLPF